MTTGGRSEVAIESATLPAGSCSAKAVANYFLDVAERQGGTLNPMKIQKLVYIAHGWHLAIRERPLIQESVEAWEYGPIIADLYHEFKKFGNMPITERAIEIKSGRTGGGPFSINFSIEEPTIDDDSDDPEYTRRFLDRVWEVYGGFTAVQLSNMTHELGTPWHETKQLHRNKRSVSIPDETIAAYYRKRVDENVNRTRG